MCDDNYCVFMFLLLHFMWCGYVCVDILMDVDQEHGTVEEDKKRSVGDFFNNVLG
jgi:hypothetical protein